MRGLRLVLLAAGVAGASLALASCGGGGEKGELVIGDLVPLTGDLSDFGPPGEKAANIAADQINKAADETGADITGVKLITEDSQTDPGAAVSAARKMVDEDATCIAGEWASSDTIPVSRSVAIPEGVLLISPASTSAEITGLDDNGLVNRTPPADNLQGPALANFIEDQLGGAKGKTVSVAGRNDSYGEGLTGFFADAWEAKGGKVAGPVLYDPKAASYDSEAQKIVAPNPDAYVIVDFPDPFVKVGPALVRTGSFDASKTFITDGLASTDVAKESYTDGFRGTAPGTPEKGAPSEAFDKLYTSSAPKNVGRQTFDAQNFDAVMLCYLAAVAAGSTDGQDMADALQAVTAPPGTQYTWEQLPEAIKALQDGDDIDYVGASGDINLDDNGDPSVGVYDELLFKNGEIASVGQVPAEKAGG
jgi:ABC-type branched-subunit amino acid transport system substrate-binding protein